MNAPYLGSRLIVDDYRKRGDTDDTASFQRAIDVAQALVDPSDGYGPGITVFAPAENYVLSQTLRISEDYISLRGSARAGTRLSRSTDYGDTLLIAPPSYAITNYMAGNHVKDFTFAHFGAIPTHGAHVHHVACARYTVAGVDAVGMYGGFDIESCNTGINYSRVGIYTDYDFWTPGGVQPGSFGMRFIENASVLGYKPPSEVFVSNFNIRGGNKDASSPYCLDRALDIKSGDGIWFQNGHAGFAANQSALIEPQGSSTTIQSVFLTSVYLDGNVKTQRGIYLSKTGGGEICRIKMVGGAVQNHALDGIFSTFTAGNPHAISFTDVDIVNNRYSGVNVSGGSRYRLNGCTIEDNGADNPNAPQIIVGNISDSKIWGNDIGRNSARAGNGILVSGTPDRIIEAGNNFFNNTTDVSGSLGPNSVSSLNIHG